MSRARIGVYGALVVMLGGYGGCRPRIGSGPTAAPGEHHATAGPSVPAAAPARESADPRAAWVARHRVASAPSAGGDRIAVLLPLSGAYAPLGRALRPAIELGLGGEAVFLDTGGSEAGAVAAVDQAAAAGAALILGPVGVGEARAAARRAVRLGLPIALLAPDDAPAAPREGIYRLVPSAESEARALAAIVVGLGHDRVAVLAPDDEQGAAQAAAFAAAAEAAGARVIRRAAYDPTGAELEATMKRFLGLDPASNARLRRHLARAGKDGWKTFSPDVDFDLLYLPDEHARAALVVAYLPFFNVELRGGDLVDTLALREKHGGRLPSVVQLVGSSGWHHPALVAAGGPAIEGAYLAARCPGAAGEATVTAAAAGLLEAYERRTGGPPGAAAMQAHDAARLVGETRRAVRGQGAGALAIALSGARLDDGACGAAAVGRDGQLRREVVLYQVDGGGLAPVAY